MKTFKINKDLEVVCEWKKTRNAFKHEATLLKNGQEIEKVKICYQNRTWEKYEFDSVMKELAEKTGEKAISKFVKNRKSDSGPNFLKAIGTVAKLGEVFGGGDQKKTNDWKKRMLEAGLGGKGLTMPEDWDKLDENEKEKRLNGAIGTLSK